jgi:UDP-glucose 4-epimerase
MPKIILVTGGAGHVGSHIIEQLIQKNPQDKIISLDNYFNGSKDNHIAGAEYRQGHTKDIDKIIPETPDIIFHLGEYARIAPSFDDVEKVFDMNTVGTFAVVEFFRKRGVKKLVYSASSNKFSNNCEERHANPYSFTKANNVDLINNYGKWYNLPYTICYFYNAYGPREKGGGKYGTAIANFQKAYLEGSPMKVTQPGTQKRNFTYVGDLARGMILATEKGNGDGYTLNNPKAYSILEIAEAFGGPIEMVGTYSGRKDSGNAPIEDKARTELGWETTVDILDYIKDFIKTHPRNK